MEKIYKTTGIVSFYRIRQIDPNTSKMITVRKIAIQFNIDDVPLFISFTNKGEGIKIPNLIKITPEYSDSISFIYCGILEPDEKREEYNIKVEYSVKVILDIVESTREISITERQKNILLKKL